jgi:hypothetical protein
MEKLVFKNMYLNLVIGGILVLTALLGYFLNWFEDLLPFFVGAILILLSTKRFVFQFKKTKSKNATLILGIEFLVDLIIVGLLIYLQDHLSVFIGLVVYIRGVSYLLINYIATRKIQLVQYIMNIGFVTLGAFLMFGPINSEQTLVILLSSLFLIIGAIYLQAGFKSLVDKEKKKDQKAKDDKQIKSALKEKQKEERKDQLESSKKQEKIEQLEEKVKKIESEHKEAEKETNKLQKELKAVKKPITDYQSKTVVELKALAKQREITGYSSMTKDGLIKVLTK